MISYPEPRVRQKNSVFFEPFGNYNHILKHDRKQNLPQNSKPVISFILLKNSRKNANYSTLYRVGQKTGSQSHGHNSVKS